MNGIVEPLKETLEHAVQRLEEEQVALVNDRERQARIASTTKLHVLDGPVEGCNCSSCELHCHYAKLLLEERMTSLQWVRKMMAPKGLRFSRGQDGRTHREDWNTLTKEINGLEKICWAGKPVKNDG